MYYGIKVYVSHVYYCTRKQYFRNAISDLNVRGMRGALIMGSAYLRAGGGAGVLNRRFTVIQDLF